MRVPSLPYPERCTAPEQESKYRLVSTGYVPSSKNLELSKNGVECGGVCVDLLLVGGVSEQQTEQVGSVLVVDDNPMILSVLSTLLANEGYEVLSASNGVEALKKIHGRDVDLILSDVMMPEMDGYTFHTQLRGEAKHAQIPFIFLTALDDRGEMLQGKEVGVDDYLLKPFDPSELLAVVKGKIIRGRERRQQAEAGKEEFRKRVLHTLSHEFRTPLVAINTGAELLQTRPEALSGDKALRLIDAIRRGGERLERLVNDFMLLQQLDAGICDRVASERAEEVSIAALFEGFLEVRGEEIRSRGYELEVRVESAERVRVFRSYVEDLLWRLTSNAMKFSTPPALIEVGAENADNLVHLFVRDRGIGIDPERLSEAFKPFGQLDREKMEQQGSGLGLAVAVRLARVLGGDLVLRPRSGGGTEAMLRLPVIMTVS